MLPDRSLLALLLVCAAAPAVQQPEAPEERRESLEAYLERARGQRTELLAKLQPRVEAILSRAERAGTSPRREPRDSREALAGELASLGVDVAPLLVPHLDTGGTANPGKQECAVVAVVALTRIGVAPVIEELLALLRDGAEATRAHAARALAAAPEDERTRPALRAAFEQTGNAATRHAILKALIELGGPRNDELLRDVLTGEDPALVGLALGALRETRSAAAADAVRALLSDVPRASRHIGELVEYYKAVPSAFGGPELRAAVALSMGSAAIEQRVLLLESVWQMWSGPVAEVSRAFAPVLSSVDNRTREAALVSLSRLGDRSARKEALKPYDETVDRSDRYPDAYARRAQMHARLGDDDAAIKDYLRALQAARNDGAPPPDVHAGLARSYARRGKLREAADVMIKGLSPAQRRSLENDPDFKDLAASKYGKDVFGR